VKKKIKKKHLKERTFPYRRQIPSDTVGIDFEREFNLRDTTRSRWNTGELEFAEEVVILGK